MGRLCANFKVFGGAYFIYLLLAIAIIVTLVLLLRKLNKDKRRIVEIVLVSLIGLFVILEFVGKMVAMPGYKLGDNLPLNIIDVFAVVALLVLLGHKSTWTKFSYFIITPVCGYSLIFMPKMYETMSAVSLSIVSFVLVNALLLAYGLLNLFWTEEYLEKKDIVNVTTNFLIILAFAHIINVFFRFTTFGLGANYCGTMGENFDTILGWLGSLISWPFVSMLPLIAVLVGVEFLLVLPFDMLNVRRQKQEKLDEMVALGNMKAQQQYRQAHTRTSSQILLHGEKAKPNKDKDVYNSTSKDDFVKMNKEVKVNKEIRKD